MDYRHYFCVLIFVFLLFNCGGGGGQYYPPSIAINKISVVKEEVIDLEVTEVEKIWLTVDLERQPLHELFVGGIKLYYINGFQFQGKEYSIGIPIDNFVYIIDSERNMIKKLDTPRYARNA